MNKSMKWWLSGISQDEDLKNLKKPSKDDYKYADDERFKEV